MVKMGKPDLAQLAVQNRILFLESEIPKMEKRVKEERICIRDRTLTDLRLSEYKLEYFERTGNHYVTPREYQT